MFKSMKNKPRSVAFKKDAGVLGFVPAQELPLPLAFTPVHSRWWKSSS